MRRAALPFVVALVAALSGGALAASPASGAPAAAVRAAEPADGDLAVAEPPTLNPGPGQYVPLPPAVIQTFSLLPGQTGTVKVTEARGVPEAGQVSAVALQVVADNAAAAGSVQVFPAGPRPSDSLLYVAPGRSASSFETVRVSADGEVSVNATAGTRVSLRLRGYYTSAGTTSAGGTYLPLPPAKLVNAVPLPAGGTQDIVIAGRNGVPADGTVTAVALQVAATNPQGIGYLSTFPAGATVNRNTYGSVFYPAGLSRAGLDVVKVTQSGTVTVSTSAAATVHIWLRGYYQSPEGRRGGAAFVPLDPTVLVNNVPVTAGSTTTRGLAGIGGIPADPRRIAAVELRTVAVGPTSSSWIQTWPGGTRPSDVSVYFANGVTTGGVDVSYPSVNGEVNFFANGATRLSVRLRGYFKRPDRPGAPTSLEAIPGDGRVTLRWAPPADDGGAVVAGYNIGGGRTADDGTPIFTTQYPATPTELVLTGLRNGTTYRYWISTATGGATSELVQFPLFTPQAPAG